ncbi:TSUP family transporter [candidate division KSB1 bacterium]
MEYILIAVAALFVSGMTLYSGFGLGTLLMPVFALFIPVEAAVAATAVVHGANSVIKASFMGKRADRGLAVRFGIPALLAAFVGAALLGVVSKFPPLAEYELFGRTAVVTPIKLLMGVLILGFALMELLPKFRGLKFDRKYLVPGGLMSGFFGGLSGHQGALRAAFLVKAGVSTEAYVGTNAVIALMVDTARITVYGAMALGGGFSALSAPQVKYMMLAGIVAAFCGVFVGSKFVHKVTMDVVQTLTGILLLGIGVALGAGVI